MPVRLSRAARFAEDNRFDLVTAASVFTELLDYSAKTSGQDHLVLRKP
jgi:hypothetical protein